MSAFAFTLPAIFALAGAIAAPDVPQAAPPAPAVSNGTPAAPAIPQFVPSAPAVPQASSVSLAPLRHLEYAVNEKADGTPSAFRLDVDLTAVTPERGLNLRLMDGVGGAGSELDAHLDRQAGLSVSGEGGFSDREEVLLAFFTLSFENVGGLEKGAKFVRTHPTPDGTATTSYEVRAIMGSLVDLAVTHALVENTGWTSTWQGKVLYDASASAPTLVELTGESTLEMKLAVDSFAAAQVSTKR